MPRYLLPVILVAGGVGALIAHYDGPLWLCTVVGVVIGLGYCAGLGERI